MRWSFRAPSIHKVSRPEGKSNPRVRVADLEPLTCDAFSLCKQELEPTVGRFRNSENSYRP
jgi:hypothetical protein